jgi:hypothetical protein
MPIPELSEVNIDPCAAAHYATTSRNAPKEGGPVMTQLPDVLKRIRLREDGEMHTFVVVSVEPAT